MDRRTFTKQLLGAVASYALFDALFATHAFARSPAPELGRWALRLNEYCQDLKKEAIRPLEWQQKIEELYATVDLDEILRFIDLERLSKGFEFPDLGVNTCKVVFPRLEGLPEKTVFVKKIFGMQKGRAIIPDGHSNMASAHLVLRGDLHLRHYDKVGQEDNHLIVRPVVDRVIGEGECSTISDERGNVHWFVAESETAFTFDVIMLDLGGTTDIHNLDMLAAQDLHDGTYRAAMLDVGSALKKYGKQSHH